MFTGIGAKWGSIWTVASAKPFGPREIDLTFPTEMPEIRTSDSIASWLASLNGTVRR